MAPGEVDVREIMTASRLLAALMRVKDRAMEVQANSQDEETDLPYE